MHCRIPWQCLIVDEGHRLKNSSTVLHKLLKEVSGKHVCVFPATSSSLSLPPPSFPQMEVPFSLLLTGTPVQNNLTELYSLLSFVARSVFPALKQETFVQHFSNISGRWKHFDL